MTTKLFPLDTLGSYQFVVILSAFRGRLMLSRHRRRSTWEFQGGHIEPGETPLQAARRELYEESGAVRFEITPIFDYQSADDTSTGSGMVFIAGIEELGPLPESEIGEISFFEALPENLTYPGIAPALWNGASQRLTAVLAGQNKQGFPHLYR